ncbi:MAG TPA: hypothetical protein VFQ88_02970 [Nevskiaceae bacterium]|nr:hypothetical protein [Nevskiaceae bacterium]
MNLTERSDLPAEAEWKLGPLAYFPGRLATACACIAIAMGIGYFKLAFARGAEIAAAFGVLAILLYVFRFAYNKRTTLYMDAAGVWVERGLLPWQHTINGLKWCDMKSADTHQGLKHWLTQSYPVTIVERFTGKVEIDETYVWHGQRAVDRIDKRLIAERAREEPAAPPPAPEK